MFVCVCLCIPWEEDEEGEEVKSDRMEGGEEQLQQLDIPTATV